MIASQRKELLDFIATISVKKSKDISEATDFYDDLGFDSLDCVELVLWIEHRYKFSISDSEVIHCATVGDVINLINRRTGQC